METLLFWGNGEDLSDFLSAQPNGLVKNIEIQYNAKLGKAYVRSDNRQVMDLLSRKFQLKPVSPEEEFLGAVAADRSGWITVYK
ncbi:hypothetical protein SAMN04487995_0451 [Dyadobacter koreensis]|uniref:Uncharacterized protein n=1 Tax=Dyadobacter koreensis TaxID=408657 RepID=A0A1H6QA55_9BACT|nr:hypothetical protein [Dyadobacter koreensis]SEI40671.1 hypothetical protein SAMN04487995_0451 [Dyadobacter koreensis]